MRRRFGSSAPQFYLYTIWNGIIKLFVVLVPSAELPTNEQRILPAKDDSADQPSKKRSREEIGQEECCQECMIAESVMKRLLRSPEFVRMLQSMPHGESREVRVVQTAQGVSVHMKVPPAPEEQPSEKH